MKVNDFAKMIGEISYDNIPEEVKRKVCQCCQDMVGVFSGGKNMKEATIVLNSLADASGKITDSANKALWIGAVTRLLDFDDGQRRAMGHPGVPIFSTAWAMVLTENVNGKIFMEAVVRGYEIYCHLGRVINPTAYLQRGFDATSICGAVAASVVAGTILHLNQEKMAHAMSIAASLCGGLNQYAIDGGSPKYLCAGWGALLGIRAAKLANYGADGPSGIFEGKKGYCQGFAVTYDTELLADTQIYWDILGVYLKRFACVRRLHAALDIVDEAVQNRKINKENVQSIDILGSHFIAESAVYAPADVVLAQTSMPYSIALLLKFGAVTEELLKDNLKNDEVNKLSELVHIKEDEAFNELLKIDKGLWGAVHVTVTTKSGEVFEKTLKYALGEQENPLPLSICRKKFMMLASKSITEPIAEKLFITMAQLENVENMQDLAISIFE